MFTQPNCEKQYIITLPSLPDLENIPTIGDTTLIQQQSLDIDLRLNPLEWAVLWSDADMVNCDTCMHVVITPSSDTEITVYLTHESGCTYVTTFFIKLENKENDLHIPNIFSPNGDQVNDEWSITPPTDLEILDCKIYDRWSNLVYESNDKLPNWDGKFNGKSCEQGVYIFVLKYKESQDKEKIMTGDITLVK